MANNRQQTFIPPPYPVGKEIFRIDVYDNFSMKMVDSFDIQSPIEIAARNAFESAIHQRVASHPNLYKQNVDYVAVLKRIATNEEVIALEFQI